MEAEDALALFNLHWFQTLILRRRNPPPPPPPPTPATVSAPSPAEPIPPPLPLLLHRRSQSDDLPSLPPIQIPNPNPQSIFSRKIQLFPHPACEIRSRRRPKGQSKSLTDLEFEELKGFMDLGFTFSDAEAADPRLISLVPGLQRRRDPAQESSYSKSGIGALHRAPYLSEVWDAKPYVLRNWRIPVAGEGVDLKDHLRLWAQAVAYAVR